MSDLQCPVRLILARAGDAIEGQLTAAGCARARELGASLRAARIACVYTSGEPAAAETARLVAAELGIAVPARAEWSGTAEAGVARRLDHLLEDIADRHRGEAVLLVVDRWTLSRSGPDLGGLPLPASPADPVWVELEGDADGWRFLAWSA